MPLSTRLIVSPRRVAGPHQRTRLGSTLCLSPPGSACLLGESQARTIGQGFDIRFISLHQAQRVFSPSHGLAPHKKAWVQALPLSTRLIVTPRQVTSSHRRTRLGSTLCLSLPLSACLLAESLACTHGQGLGPCFASLHQAQRVSSPIRWLAPLDKDWVHALPLPTRLSVSPRRVAG